MTNKGSLAWLNRMPEYQQVITFLRSNKTILASDIVDDYSSVQSAASTLKHMSDMELLNRKRIKGIWTYSMPLSMAETTYEWETNKVK